MNEFTSAEVTALVGRGVKCIRPVGRAGEDLRGKVVKIRSRDPNEETWSIAVRWDDSGGREATLDWFDKADLGTSIELLKHP